MKQTIKLKESELKRMIAESVKRVLMEDLDNIKSWMWKKKNLPKSKHSGNIADDAIQSVKRENKKPYNPYTYNKRNFHLQSPEYGSKDFDKMYNADDGWVMGKIQRDIENMKSYLMGEKNYDEAHLYLMGYDDDSIHLAKKYGLTKYYQYLEDLYKMVIQKRKSEI
jgi:hypothetical protein